VSLSQCNDPDESSNQSKWTQHPYHCCVSQGVMAYPSFQQARSSGDEFPLPPVILFYHVSLQPTSGNITAVTGGRGSQSLCGNSSPKVFIVGHFGIGQIFSTSLFCFALYFCLHNSLILQDVRQWCVYSFYFKLLFVIFQNYPDIDIHTILSKAIELKRPRVVAPNPPPTHQRQKAGFQFKKRWQRFHDNMSFCSSKLTRILPLHL